MAFALSAARTLECPSPSGRASDDDARRPRPRVSPILFRARATRRDARANAGGDADVNRERGEIIVYTKPGCCLCDGLRDKLETALEGARAGARSARTGATRDSLRDFVLVARDVSTRESWAELYAGSVPRVFVRDLGAVDGEYEFPRPTPKASAERIGDDLHALIQRSRGNDGDSSDADGWTVVSSPDWNADGVVTF